MIMALHFKLYNFIIIFKIKAIYIIKVLILEKNLIKILIKLKYINIIIINYYYNKLSKYYTLNNKKISNYK